ncbi:MAG: hypothetical protein M0Z28_05280, partial [Rhodospirillales bacterium]|nr:hypothetical protein [Rhodospirillales bacterium]
LCAGVQHPDTPDTLPIATHNSQTWSARQKQQVDRLPDERTRATLEHQLARAEADERVCNRQP